MLQEWLYADIVFNNYLSKYSDGSTASPINIDNGGKVDLVELVHKFDSLRYFDETGNQDFPSITLLARVHLSKMGNGGEQERLFSTASLAQGQRQGKMFHDRLEKRALLNHNKKFRKKHKLC